MTAVEDSLVVRAWRASGLRRLILGSLGTLRTAARRSRFSGADRTEGILGGSRLLGGPLAWIAARGERLLRWPDGQDTERLATGVGAGLAAFGAVAVLAGLSLSAPWGVLLAGVAATLAGSALAAARDLPAALADSWLLSGDLLSWDASGPNAADEPSGEGPHGR